MRKSAQKSNRPPKIAEYILERALSEYNDFALLGDFNEEYSNILREEGSFAAKIWYWKQVAFSFPKLLLHLFYWGVVMIKNYFKIALRNFSRQKVYSFINVTGLAIGIASFILIFMWVVDETSYDNFHEKSDSIYRVTYAENIGGDYTHYALAPFPSGPAFYEEIPEVTNFTRFNDRTGLITIGKKKFDVKGITYVDSTFFNIFSFPLLEGDIHTALKEPNSIILTEESAKKLFGNENPIGKSLDLNADGSLKVTGVVADCPKNSHFDFNYLVSWSTLEKRSENWVGSWLSISGWVYLVLDNSADPKIVEEKMAGVVNKHVGERIKENGYKLYYFLQNIKDIHLNSHLVAEFGPNGDANNVRIFSMVAIFVLLLACINFMNLSTAKSVVRSKEVGLRKVLGAHRGKLIAQFITESVLMTLISFVLAIFIIALVLPLFNSITGKDISLLFLLNPIYIFGLSALLFVTGIIAGSYPAFYISSFQPTQVLKSQLTQGTKKATFRNSLVVFQFIVSILLAASTLIILQQLNFMRETELGFNKDQVLLLKIKSDNIDTQPAVFKTELLQHNNIKNGAYASGVPGEVDYVLSVFQKGKAKSDVINTDVIFTNYGYLETLGLKLISGRDFSEKFVSDSSGAFIVNETMAKKLGGIDECLGKYIGFSTENTQPVVGVVKDFHYESVKNPIGPMAIKLLPEAFKYMALKVSPVNLNETIEFAKDTWKKFESDREFSYSFLDTKFEEQYISEERAGRIVSIFAILSGLIACLGLFGLSSYAVSQKTKEIGIRKVLGGSSSKITYMLTKTFIKLVLIANMVALPIAYYILNEYWLINFAMRIDISIIFLFALGFASLLIAVITISFQAIKAATANPVDSLKYE